MKPFIFIAAIAALTFPAFALTNDTPATHFEKEVWEYEYKANDCQLYATEKFLDITMNGFDPDKIRVVMSKTRSMVIIDDVYLEDRKASVRVVYHCEPF